MSYDRPLAPRSARTVSSSVSNRRPWTVKSAPVSQRRPSTLSRSVPLTRRFELNWLEADGYEGLLTRIAPALPAFEEAFAAFTHGTMIQTAEGPVAVEDLTPGMALTRPDGRHAELRWKGSITLVPGAATLRERAERLYRVTPDAFGPSRPSRDVLLGPDARLLSRDPAVRSAVGSDAAFVPISSLADGVSVIEVTPIAPTKVYHLVTDRHGAIVAGGLEVETFAPSSSIAESLSHEMMAAFMSLFPHLQTLRDFGGARWPRLSPEMMDAVY